MRIIDFIPRGAGLIERTTDEALKDRVQLRLRVHFGLWKVSQFILLERTRLKYLVF